MKIIELEVTEYTDSTRRWWGLKDGTLLDLSDPKGRLWFQYDNQEPKPITFEQMA